MLNELGNESKIYNDSKLMFPLINKQDVSPTYSNKPLKFSKIISHERAGANKGKKCTAKDLSKIIENVSQSVRLTFLENRDLLKSINDGASHMNNANKSINNNKVSAPCNHSPNFL